MKGKFFWITLYAIAMAYLEATVVVYLRELYYPENLQLIFPPNLLNKLDFAVELGREASTVVMMLAVAFLAEGGNRMRTFAAFAYQFGVWDVFYYIWLKVTIGWPINWGEWDVLFLIPWVWLGPWICPVLIAILLAVWGAWILLSERKYVFSKSSILVFVSGAVMALIAFLQPAIPILVAEGAEGLRQFIPGNFWWGLFIPGYLLMTVGLGLSIYRVKPGSRTLTLQ